MKKRILFAIVSLASSMAVISAEDCNSLLNLGLYNVNQSNSASDAQAMARSTFCSADYNNSSTSSSQAAAIEASYGLFSGGASGSVSRQEIITKQSQLCTSGFNSSAYSATASSYAKTVYQGTLDAWNKCKELANRGLVFSIQPSSTLQGVSVSITAPTGLTAIFYGIAQYGAGESVCKTMANGKVLDVSTSSPFTFTAASKVTASCTRKMKASAGDLTADAQDLVFITSADNLTVPLAAIGNFSRLTADQIKADLTKANREAIAQAMTEPKATIDSLDKRVSQVTGSVTALNNNISIECQTVGGPGPAEAVCPSGFIVTGCSAGKNYGSYTMSDGKCQTHTADVDWTNARCCRVKK